MQIAELVHDADRCCYTVGETATHLVDILPMLYNHRVVLTPKACPAVWDWGWCYPSLLAAVAAVSAWDVDSEPEPVGYLKRAHSGHELRPVSVR